MTTVDTKTKGFWEECITLKETPKPVEPLSYDYTIVINSNVSFQSFWNTWYWLTPSFTAENAHKRREKVMKLYDLRNDEVVIYARPNSHFVGKP